jgi:hypothetical protein
MPSNSAPNLEGRGREVIGMKGEECEFVFQEVGHCTPPADEYAGFLVLAALRIIEMPPQQLRLSSPDADCSVHKLLQIGFQSWIVLN